MWHTAHLLSGLPSLRMVAMTTEPQQSAAQAGGIPADSFANRLMLARAFAGHLSIRDAADLCDLGRGAWTNWEKGAKPADKIEIAEVISEKLGIDFDWLLFGGQLSNAEGRSQGRKLTRRRGGADPGTNPKYPDLTDRTIGDVVRPRDNRPNGRPGAGSARTAYVERPGRRRRGR